MVFEMMNGIVKWFDKKKGFGFILHEGKDLFFHITDVKNSPAKVVKDGGNVTFQIGDGTKGEIAINIMLD